MNPNFITISNSRYKEIVHADKIMYCMADGSYSKLILNDNRLLTTSKNLRWIQQRLCGNTFIRVHKSFLVNIYFISKIYCIEDKLMLLDGTKIPLARNRRKQMWEKFEAHNEQGSSLSA